MNIGRRCLQKIVDRTFELEDDLRMYEQGMAHVAELLKCRKAYMRDAKAGYAKWETMHDALSDEMAGLQEEVPRFQQEPLQSPGGGAVVTIDETKTELVNLEHDLELVKSRFYQAANQVITVHEQIGGLEKVKSIYEMFTERLNQLYQINLKLVYSSGFFI